MKTVLKLGPGDQGKPVTSSELESAEYQPGYRYELIEGKLYVSPLPNAPQGWVERWIYRRLDRYTDERPDIVNYAYNKTRVFVPDQPAETVPEPVVAVYENFPLAHHSSEINWEDASPILVVEVLADDAVDKDLVRNVRLYRLVSSIREYWILDGREDSDRPSMIVYRRQGSRWRKYEFAAGETYTTKLLPGFELVLDTRR